MEEDFNFLEKPKRTLVSRLYKNFSVRQLDQSIEQSQIYNRETSMLSQVPSTILGTSVLNISKKLVPKVALHKKLNPIDTQLNISKQFEEGLTIERGKVVINQTKFFGQQPKTTQNYQSMSQVSILRDKSLIKSLETMPNTGKASKKLDKIDKNILSETGKKFLDDDTFKKETIQIEEQKNFTQSQQLMLPQERSTKTNNQIKNLIKEKRAFPNKKGKKKGKGKKINSNKDNTNDIQDYLTPSDFIHLIRTDPEMADEFTYLNKQSHPYDFKIVDFDERNSNEYMTISARGITHFINGEATFITVEEWEREAKMFHQLLEIEFFKQYKKWKSFSLWKKLMRKSRMKNISNFLNQSLFSVDKNLGPALLRVRELCLMSKKISYIDTSISQAKKYDEFKQYQESYRMKTTDVKLDTVESSIKEVLVNNCKKSLVAFKEENRIPLKDDKGEDIVEEQAPLLVGDETGKEMPFTQEATIRTHFKRLNKFVKLIDYLILDSKIEMINNCTELISQQIEERNENNEEDKKFNNNLSSWIIVEASAKATTLVFTPDRSTLKKIFENIIQSSVTKISQKHKQMIKLEELQQFIINEEDSQSQQQDDQTGLLELIFSDYSFKENQLQVARNLDKAFDYVEKYAKFLIPFIKKYEENIAQDLESFEKSENDSFRVAMNVYIKQDEEFQNIEPVQELGLIQFDNDQFKEKIKNCASLCLNNIQTLMPKLLSQRANEFYQKVNKYNQKIAYLPTTVESFVKFNEDVNQIANHMDDITAEKSEIEELNIIIEQFKIKCPESIKQIAKDASSSLKTLREKLEEAQNSSDQNLTKFRLQCERMSPSVNLRVKELNEELSEIPYSNEEAPLDKTLDQLKDISLKVQEANDFAKKIMDWQIALQAETNSFEKLQNFTKDFQIIEKLWLGMKEWDVKKDQWSKSHFQKIDMEETSNSIEKLSKISNICSKELEANPNARNLKVNIENFKNIFGALVSLRDPALTDEAWDEIREFLYNEANFQNAFAVLTDEQYTVNYIEQNQLHNYKDQLAEIALKAAKEAELKKMLKTVKQFWDGSQLAIMPYKNKTDVYIIDTKQNEDLISKLDDTMLTVNNILASRFVEGIRKEVEEQMNYFRYLQQLLDEWYTHQKNWTYLEPILNSAYAQKNMAKEVKGFNTADASWKKMMKKANDQPNALNWAKDCNKKEWLHILEKNNLEFEKIQKALEELLEKKRDVFQRFYFLSDDELLEILSQAKDLKSVVQHLRKCFENIVKLKFDHNDSPIGMISAEGEMVPLKNFFARGDEVEGWFKDLEESMKNSLKTVFRNSLQKYEGEETERKKWVLMFPCQIILGLDAVLWTKITEENYLIPEADGDLYDWLDGNQQQLNDLTELINGPLDHLQRRTLASLAVQDVHYRDIIEEMANEGVDSITDFKWQMQLRLYIEEDSIIAKQVNARLPYCYEYLGSTTRLVITPLTDRCWMTITGALGINLGAAPAGPAGTGKTESCKDLAKVLGKYCLVYNCSDQVNVKTMEKLFMGLCQTGSWTCLDEFNRIDIEVLSVIAQQVLTIREALLDRKEKFEFFGKYVTLAPTADMGIFTTMNPGYAGRTELPDNLKVLFRPVAMMVPDYTLIAEIMLFSEGFSQSRVLSRKMTKLYKLSSEQLSQQDHYDFGMRAVKSVLVMAGGLKRSEQTASEDLVLIRAMRDSNVPKFLAHDIPLFNAIVQDLFPGIEIPPISNPELQKVIEQNIELQKLKPIPAFVEKILQFHETQKVRFGVMLVGPTMAGKTTCLKLLQQSYIQLDEELRKANNGVNNHPQFQNVLCSILNPKAITMEELYGNYDPLSQAWTDGLASTLMRDYSAIEDTQKKWVCFDGPVDAIWIENMNSVLDDSMTLCLSNGERIKLKYEMRMLFEVQDLAVASPATVSRCGMVYMDQQVVGYNAIVGSFFDRELESLIIKEDDRNQLKQNLRVAFSKIMNFYKKYHFKSPIATCDANLAIAVCRNIKLILGLEKNLSFLEKLSAPKALDRLLIWAFCWGIGASLSSQGLQQFEKCLQDIFPLDLIPRGSVFDYYFAFKKPEGEFMPWVDEIPEFNFDQTLSYFQLVVPTKDTVCYSWFIQKSIMLLQPIFLTGMTGTGKTIIANDTLNKMKIEGTITSLEVTFSAKTSALSTQFQIESKLQSQRKNKRVILMPPPGKKLAIFVDDINMPTVEQYGAQPPIELLRQYIDYKGVYDRKGLFWKDIEDTVLIICAAPPGGGRSPLTPRFARHFNVMNVPDSNQDVLTDIFSKILKGFLKVKGFKKELQDLGESNSIVNATLQIYEQIQQALLPTPAKSHYIFNLRDVSKVFQGLLLSKPRVIMKNETFAKLWLHEASRVFHDRLIDDNDRQWFMENLVKCSQTWLKQDWTLQQVFFDKVPLMFSNFMDKDLVGEDRIYQEVKEYDKLIKILDQYMSEDTKLNLVLFRDAIEHMSRVSRVLSMQRGHFMLVGVGGSGKKSLTTMATAMSLGKLMNIEPRKNYGKKDWKEDIYKMMKIVALEDKSVVFLFDDTSILQEGFLEDINNLLNSGEIPNLLGKEELEEINNGSLKDIANKMKISDVYSLFCERVRNNLHVVLALSPVGGLLRVRMRMYPSIVNCTTIDWLNPWPEEALLTVARMNLENLEFEGLTKERKQSLAECCMYTHKTVENQCDKFFENLRRKIYITPKSYIDLINAYKDLLNKKYDELNNNKNKLSTGLFKLQGANDIIAELKEKLTLLQPILDQKTIEIEIMIEKLNIDRQEANKKRVVVEEEESVVGEKAAQIKDVKDEADKVLQAALPMLKQANEALNILDRKVIAEIKANQNPHPLVLFSLECVNCLFEEKQDWDNIKKVLSDTNLLQKMKNYDIYNMKEKTENAIKKKIQGTPEFTPAEVKKKSESAQAICQWVLAVANFTDVNKEINKKKTKVADMDIQLQKANQELSHKQNELKKVVDKVEALEKQFSESKKEQDRLIGEKKLTGDRLERAEQLTYGLADEQVRWKETVETLGEDIKLIIGNVYIAASSLAYYGPFTGTYREELVDLWLKRASECDILCSEKYSLASVLGQPVVIRNWNAKGLPSDSVSINNGILVFNSRAFPLVIDPQLQASKWIKNLEQENRIKYTKMASGTLIKDLETCVRMGQPLLIEDMEETLEPMLEPLLTRQFKVVNRRKMIRIGDVEVEYDENFKLFIQTKLSNPNFLPDIFIRVTVINFTVTVLGLEEQLLADVVIKERPEVEQVKNELIVQIAGGKLQLKKNEDKILELLSSSKGMILDDVELIENLKVSKKTAEHVKLAIAVAEEKQIEIDAARAQYQSVAERGSILFFAIADLTLIDPMYQFSLSYFKRLFGVIIDQAEKCDDVDQRVSTLIKCITEIVFLNVCRGLFNDHKKIFSFLVASAISLKKGDISKLEWNIFNRGLSLSKEKPLPLPQGTKLSEKTWNDINNLKQASSVFENLAANVSKNLKVWESWIFSKEIYNEKIPAPYETEQQPVTFFQRLLLIRQIREEKSLYAMSNYVESTIGPKFTAASIPTMEDVFADTDFKTPLIFILSQGADPQDRLIRFSKQMKISQVDIISLGQGQGPIAEEKIRNGIQNGSWVVLQNCHLGKSFMPTLEKTIEGFNDPVNKEQEINPQFRLILTSMPCDYFPVSILQNGIKLTNEPPKGLKANIMKTYGEFNQEKFEDCTKVEVWKKLLFSLSFSHAILQERRKFGPLGWNIRYEFNDSDLDTGITILKNMLESQTEIPWQALRYVIGDITYGGRVTDDWDRRTLKTVLGKYIVEDVLQDGFKLSESGIYQSYQIGNLDYYRDLIKKFPEYETPEVFGMHDNANITFQLKESKVALETVLSIQPRETGGGGQGEKSTDQVVDELCQLFQEKLPEILTKPEKPIQKQGSSVAVQANEPKFIDSLVVCCDQECERFNILIKSISISLSSLRKAIKGEFVMSADLDKMYQSLLINQVPMLWKGLKSYPSLKPLASWFDDLIQRITFFRSWLNNPDGRPKCFWISAFFFPQGFLTSVLQNYARQNQIAIDVLGFSFKFMSQDEPDKINAASETGAYIYGLYIEGCQFDTTKGGMEDSQPNVMYVKSPIIEFIPTENYKANPNDYSMPVYKTNLRAGTLSTTGHSTNFILPIETPTKRKSEYWVMKGAAYVCQLND